MLSLEARLRALEGRLIETPERKAVSLMCELLQGDEAARGELERIAAADPGLMNGLVAVFLAGPAGPFVYDPLLDASL